MSNYSTIKVPQGMVAGGTMVFCYLFIIIYSQYQKRQSLLLFPLILMECLDQYCRQIHTCRKSKGVLVLGGKHFIF